MKPVPKYAGTPDWPRLVSNAVKALDSRTRGLDSLQDFADDVAAAAGGVEVGGFYRNGSQLMVRIS